MGRCGAVIACPLLLWGSGSVLGAQTNDTVRIDGSGTPSWGQDVKLVEEWKLGSLDGPAHETFGSIAGSATGCGRVAILDGQVPAVQQYTSAGEYSQQLGREGSGPGEYRVVTAVAIQDCETFVFDHALGRVTVYDEAGEVRQTFRTRGGGLRVGPVFQVDSSGRSWVWQRSPTNRDLDFWYRYGPEGALLDSIQEPPRDPEGPVYTLITPNGAEHPFTVETISAISPDHGLVVGRNDRYEISWEEDGITHLLQRSGQRIEVTEEEREQWEESSERFEDSGLPEAEERYPEIPRTKPFFKGFFGDSHGRLWVKVYVPPYLDTAIRASSENPKWREIATYDVFSTVDGYLARIALPPHHQIIAVGEDRILTRSTGALGEHYVTQFRIEKE